MLEQLQMPGRWALFSPLGISTGTTSTARQTLARILYLRLFVTLIGGIGLLIFRAYADVTLPMSQLGIIVAMILLSVIIGFWRLTAAWAVSSSELFGHLMLDVIFLVIVLLTVGGSTNPLMCGLRA